MLFMLRIDYIHDGFILLYIIITIWPFLFILLLFLLFIFILLFFLFLFLRVVGFLRFLDFLLRAFR